MRISTASVNIQLQRDLQNALSGIARQQDHLSSGKRILAPSDDPSGTALAVSLRSHQTAIAQFQDNVAETRTSLEMTDQVLGAVTSTITRAKELAVQGASGNNDALARQSIGAEMDQLLEALVSLANTRNARGEYIFGGQESNRAPYTATRDAAGHITDVAVNARGIDGTTPAEVLDGVTVPTGISGTAVFGTPSDVTYAFDVLIRLRNDLAANNAGVTQTLTLRADVDAAGAPKPAAYRGIDAAGDLQIAGPNGAAFVRLTANGDDPSSAVKASTSALATAAAINAATGTTGVSATATAATFTVADSAELFDDINLGPGALVINGQPVVVNLNAGNQAANRASFLAAVNALSGTTGVTAAAGPGLGYTLTAADGRNISLQTAAGTGDGSVADEIFQFTSAVPVQSVVARGAVKLTAAGGFTTTEANAPADQIGGDGVAAGISAALDQLDAVLDRAVLPQTLAGARLGWLDTLEDRLSTASVSTAGTLSRVEDLDVPKAIQEFQQMQLAYQAALASGANVVKLSLLDFLK
jgi:flagellar hook-associated protein 3 FlgL